MTAQPTQLLVLQPTPYCNIDCDYCYLPDRDVRRFMTVETVETVFRRAFASLPLGPDLSVVWHAGEPLTAPLAFYERAIEVAATLAPAGCRVVHHIQTNGIGIDQAWCELVKRHAIRIGVSIDGPAFVHDAHRRTRGGRGTHALTMKGVRRLRENGISFHAIAVVTEVSLAHAAEIVEFFLGEQIFDVGFNIEELEGMHRCSTLAGADAEARYRAFLREVFVLSKRAPGLRVREFEHARNAIEGPPGPVASTTSFANPQVAPLAIVSVDCDGNFSTFSPELIGQPTPEFDGFRFGNVRDAGFDAMSRHATFRRVEAEVAAGVEACRRSCQYFDLCGGGAPANKLAEHGTFAATETMYCRLAVQAPLDLVLEDLERSLGIATG